MNSIGMTLFRCCSKPRDYFTNIRDLDFALYLAEAGLDPVLKQFGVHTIGIIIISPFNYE